MWNLIRMLHQSRGLNQFRHFTPHGGCQVLHVTAPHCWMRSLYSLEMLKNSIYVSVCVCVCVLGAKGFRTIIKHTPSLNYCFHGEVESALKKRLHPLIKALGEWWWWWWWWWALFFPQLISMAMGRMSIWREGGLEWLEGNWCTWTYFPLFYFNMQQRDTHLVMSAQQSPP